MSEEDQMSIMTFNDKQKEFLTDLQVATIKITYDQIKSHFNVFTKDECLMILGSFAQAFKKNVEEFLLKDKNIIVEENLNIDLTDDGLGI